MIHLHAYRYNKIQHSILKHKKQHLSLLLKKKLYTRAGNTQTNTYLILLLVLFFITIILSFAYIVLMHQSNVELVRNISSIQSDYNHRIHEIQEQLSKQMEQNKILEGKVLNIGHAEEQINSHDESSKIAPKTSKSGSIFG